MTRFIVWRRKRMQSFEQLPVDGYDLFSINAIKAAGISQVISDDGDFCTVPGITLFTANSSAIRAAQMQKNFGGDNSVRPHWNKRGKKRRWD